MPQCLGSLGGPSPGGLNHHRQKGDLLGSACSRSIEMSALVVSISHSSCSGSPGSKNVQLLRCRDGKVKCSWTTKERGKVYIGWSAAGAADVIWSLGQQKPSPFPGTLHPSNLKTLKKSNQPLHGLKLVIKEEVLPATDQPQFQSLELLAGRGLLAPETWKCKRAQVSLKATIDVPMLGTIIEENGDGLLEDSHMPVGWPLHIDGAVRQCCIHRAASLQELDDMLKEYDMKRDSVEINRDAPQWSHHAVWNRKFLEPRPGYTLEQLWADSEPAISKKTTTSYDVQTNDMQRAVAAIQHFPSPVPPDSPFIRTLGTPAALKAPPQTDTLAQRALEEWERTVC